MLINGEKWACEACVRGHRVSNCQHADRRLQHINKKGRPVSQCQHCRTMRKSRASHVKCNCGEKTHKCVHLQTTVEGHKDNCCCNHGGRCTCCHKKEHAQLDTVRESDPENDTTTRPAPTSSKKGQRIRKRSNTEGVLSFDEFGHHMPVKHNKAAHNCGPYQLNRVNSLQSSSSTGNRSVDDLLHMTGKAGMDSQNGDSPASSGGLVQDGRMTRSEAASPLMPASTTLPQLGPLSSLTPLDLSIIHNPPFEPNSADFFGNISEYEQPMFSAGLSATSVDWSHYDGLDFGSARAADAPEFASSNFSQPQSYGGGFDFSGSEQLPTMTTNTSNSGDISEVEDLLPNGLEDLETGPHIASATFRDSTNSSNFDLNDAQMNMLGSANLSTLEYDKFKFLEAGTEASNYVPTYSPAATDPLAACGDDPTFSRGGLAGLDTFSVDPDRGYWMESFGPAHSLPDVTELVTSADTESVLGFWDTR